MAISMQRGKVLRIALVVSLGGFLFGFDASVISGVIRFIRPEFGLSDLQLGWVVSSPSFAAMFSMLAAGTLSDAVGRKTVLIVVAFLYPVSAILSALANGYEMLVFARMIGGVAFGAALILAPMYIAEIAPAKNRGKLVSVQQLNIVLGFSAAYFANYFVLKSIGVNSFITNGNAWRWMFALELIPASVYFLFLFLVPKSPRWLFSKRRNAEALVILKRLHGDKIAESEATRIRESITHVDSTRSIHIRELFGPGLRFVMMIGLFVGVLQQITGVNAIYFYATMIFEQAGVGRDASFAQAVWIGIINVVFTLLAMAFIDRVGRKPLLLIGFAGIAISMFLTAYGFSEATYELNGTNIVSVEGVSQARIAPLIDVSFDNDVDFKKALKIALGDDDYARLEGDLIRAAISMNPKLILIGILGFVASFAFSLGPVMWVMLSELYPNWIRGLAIAAIGFVNSFVSWGVQFIFRWELSNLGNAGTFLVYAVFAVFGFLILWRVLPETKGKSLEEIEKEFVTG